MGSKGALTKQHIVREAMKLASTVGLEGLSIGHLAQALELSKSGLFAHFGSKEVLQIEVLEAAVELFVEVVVRPALAAPRGEPRVRALFTNWLAWGRGELLPGGCLFVAASAEFDDRPGNVRDVLERSQREWTSTLRRAAELAMAEGHFRASLDPTQFAFELYSLLLGGHHYGRLLQDPDTADRTSRAFESLIEAARPDERPMGANGGSHGSE
jgi:AcrR family transcriptional regulator